MKDKLFTLMTLCILTACVNTKSESSANNDGQISFQNGDLMTDVSEDSLGNPLTYPTGEAAVTSQVKVWKPGFTSPWHYHPYTGIAYVVQGELTVNFDSNTSLEDISAEKLFHPRKHSKLGTKLF
jgi:quercetin dioxygenase-like cupin family protein